MNAFGGLRFYGIGKLRHECRHRARRVPLLRRLWALKIRGRSLPERTRTSSFPARYVDIAAPVRWVAHTSSGTGRSRRRAGARSHHASTEAEGTTNSGGYQRDLARHRRRTRPCMAHCFASLMTPPAARTSGLVRQYARHVTLPGARLPALTSRTSRNASSIDRPPIRVRRHPEQVLLLLRCPDDAEFVAEPPDANRNAAHLHPITDEVEA